VTKLHVSTALSLPEDAVTRTFVVYGGKGKGKTNFGSVLVEELAKRGDRFCVTDPLDVWWGLQHGDHAIDVVILGGTHGRDMPITPGAGEVIADFVADEDVSTVIVMRHADGRMWTNGERIRFMTAFVRRLFARQGERRRPLMLVIDEAGRFVPQTAGKGDLQIAECIGAIEELVEWGRNVGLGCCLITQRSARMAKAVSELAECMVAFQTAGPNSIKAIVEWFGEHIPTERQKELVGILRKLPVGRALVVSPEWLDFEGEAPIRLRETFDSSATPKAGGALRAPGRARKPDLAKYSARMAEVVERAKAEDPGALRATIADLRKQLAAKPTVMAAPAKTLEVAVLSNGTTKALTKAAAQMVRAAELVAEGVGRLQNIASDLRDASAPVALELHRIQSVPSARAAAAGSTSVALAVRAGSVVGHPGGRTPVAHDGSTPRSGSARGSGGPARTTEGVPKRYLQKLVDAMGTLDHLGYTQPTNLQIATWSKMSVRGGAFSGYLRELAAAGLVTKDGQTAALTDAGRAAASRPLHGASNDDLHLLARAVAKPYLHKLLNPLIEAYPQTLTITDLAEAAGMSVEGGAFSGYLRELVAYGFVTKDRSSARAADALFIAGAR